MSSSSLQPQSSCRADSLALRFFGYEVIPMSKTTFYFSVIVLVAVEVIQSGYTRKLNAERRTGAKH